MRLYVDLETLQLIEGPGFRNPVTSLRFKRGDGAALEVLFLDKGLTPIAIGNPLALEIEFGVKPYQQFDQSYLVHSGDWTMPDAEATQIYRCAPNFNTAGLNAELELGTPGERPEIILMGEITWREGAGEPTSTRTFKVIVENDVNRGTEIAPDPLQTPDQWLGDRAVRHDANQTLTTDGKNRARANIDAASLGGTNVFFSLQIFTNGVAFNGGALSFNGNNAAFNGCTTTWGDGCVFSFHSNASSNFRNALSVPGLAAPNTFTSVNLFESTGTIAVDSLTYTSGFGGVKAHSTQFAESLIGAAWFGQAGSGKTLIVNSRGSAGGGIDFATYVYGSGWRTPVIIDRSGDVTITRGNVTGGTAGTQLFFGYGNTETYRHALRTEHNGGSDAGNSISFWIWKASANAITAAPTTRVMSIAHNGAGIFTASPTEALDVVGNLTASGSNSTLPNQSVAADGSILTRLSAARSALWEATRVRHLVPGANPKINSGTGSAVATTDEWSFNAGSAAGGYAKAVIASNLHAFGSSGQGINGSQNFSLAIEAHLEVQGADGAGAFRLTVGDSHNSVPPAADAAPLADQSWGIEWKRNSGNFQCRLFGWHSTLAPTYSSWLTIQSGGTGYTFVQHLILDKSGSNLYLYHSTALNGLPSRPSNGYPSLSLGGLSTINSPSGSGAQGRITMSAVQHSSSPSPKVAGAIMGHAILILS